MPAAFLMENANENRKLQAVSTDSDFPHSGETVEQEPRVENRNSLFCEGCDRLILRPNRMTTHFQHRDDKTPVKEESASQSEQLMAATEAKVLDEKLKKLRALSLSIEKSILTYTNARRKILENDKASHDHTYCKQI